MAGARPSGYDNPSGATHLEGFIVDTYNLWW